MEHVRVEFSDAHLLDLFDNLSCENSFAILFIVYVNQYKKSHPIVLNWFAEFSTYLLCTILFYKSIEQYLTTGSTQRRARRKSVVKHSITIYFQILFFDARCNQNYK